MASLGQILGWKFNHAEGIRTREGVIVEWPAGLGGTNMPDANDIATWQAEYDVVATDVKRDEVWNWITGNSADAIVVRATIQWIGGLQVPSKTLAQCAQEIKPIIKSML